MGEIKLYWQRWYILLIFSIYTMHNCAVWNTWGPIADSAKKVYSWTDKTLTVFSLWGVVDFPIFFLPSAYLLSKSLRLSLVVGTTCVLVATVLRCLPLLVPSMGDQAFEYLCHVSAFVNAITGPIAMAAPIQLSSSWFPPNERTRATSISQMCNALGIGFSYIYGTFLVRELDSDGGNVDQVRSDIERLLYVYAGLALLHSVLIYVYFPSKPPTPPSITADEARVSFFQGFKDLMRNKNFWLVMLVYSITTGIVQMWQSVIVINLTAIQSVELTETFASTFGIVISFVAVFGSIVVAIFIDNFRKKMKLALLVLLCLASIVYILSTLLLQEVIPIESDLTFKIVLYILLVSGVTLSFACAPITFEFCVELAYPVEEGTIGICLTLFFSIVSILFLLVFQIPNIGTEWLNFVLTPSVLVPAVLLFGVTEEYRRQQMDG